jgi:hypothetical protein
MSDPFSGIPDPGTPRPIRRPSQPGVVQEARRAMQDALRARLPVAKEALRRAQWYAENLWLRGKRNPRTVGVMGGAVALTLAGAYALSASGAGRSLCPPTGGGKMPQFVVLMDPVPPVVAGSEVELHYDVCGLSSGTPYRGQVRLAQPRVAGKKAAAKPKPLVVGFKDRVDGVATRRHQDLDLASMRPGAYTLELTVADNQGRERKRVQKVLVKAR